MSGIKRSIRKDGTHDLHKRDPGVEALKLRLEVHDQPDRDNCRDAEDRDRGRVTERLAGVRAARLEIEHVWNAFRALQARVPRSAFVVRPAFAPAEVA